MEQAQERFARYLQRRYGDRSTPKHYLSDLQVFVRMIGPAAPETVTMQDIDCFVDQQREDGLVPATINRRLASLHTFFEFLASEEPDKPWPNPVNWRRHRVQQGQSLPRDASDAEVERLFAVIDDPRDRAMFGLMVGAGLRVGEVAGLQCTDLEPPPAPDQGARLRVSGKGHKERIVWITPRWYDVLTRWLQQRPAGQSDRFFLNQHGRPLSVSGIQYRLKGYCQLAGIQLTCHQLRHTFARRLADQRMPTESIGHLLGHAQIETTQRYTAGANPDLRDAFLASMASLEETPAAIPTGLAFWPQLRTQTGVADPEALKKSLKRLETLPAWLQGTLKAYVRRRWRDWQPHRAADNARVLSGQLVQAWRWLINRRSIKDWHDLQRSDLEAWLDARARAGLAVNTQRNQLTILLSCLRFAADQGIDLPANLFRVTFPARPSPLPRYLTGDEYQRLLKNVREQTVADTRRGALDWAWFLTLAHTGLRTCELLNLRLADLDFATHRLFVRGGKTGHDRVVYLTPVLTNALAQYLTQRPATQDDHLWIEEEAPLSTAQLRYRVQKWGETCQVVVTPHRLRHTLATQLINNGMPLASVGKLLGHRNLNTTQHYARLYEQTVKEQFEAAIQQVEGIAVTDWPQPATVSEPALEHIVDSV